MITIHANTTREEFVKFLYYALRDANMPPQVLDCVEDLECTLAFEDELEEAKERADTLANALKALIHAVENGDDTEFVDDLKTAQQALDDNT
jgi:replicative superfamily II helicase